VSTHANIVRSIDAWIVPVRAIGTLGQERPALLASLGVLLQRVQGRVSLSRAASSVIVVGRCARTHHVQPRGVGVDHVAPTTAVQQEVTLHHKCTHAVLSLKTFLC
jgi:hypothetical protein